MWCTRRQRNIYIHLINFEFIRASVNAYIFLLAFASVELFQKERVNVWAQHIVFGALEESASNKLMLPIPAPTTGPCAYIFWHRPHNVRPECLSTPPHDKIDVPFSHLSRQFLTLQSIETELTQLPNPMMEYWWEQSLRSAPTKLGATKTETNVWNGSKTEACNSWVWVVIVKQ